MLEAFEFQKRLGCCFTPANFKIKFLEHLFLDNTLPYQAAGVVLGLCRSGQKCETCLSHKQSSDCWLQHGPFKFEMT